MAFAFKVGSELNYKDCFTTFSFGALGGWVDEVALGMLLLDREISHFGLPQWLDRSGPQRSEGPRLMCVAGTQ